jgi:HK97 family phage prohead protease
MASYWRDGAFAAVRSCRSRYQPRPGEQRSGSLVGVHGLKAAGPPPVDRRGVTNPDVPEGWPMTLLQRTHVSDLDLSRDDAEGRTIHGLVVPFGVEITADDGAGPFREMFQRGAFARTIAERGTRVKLLINHDRRNRLPIGRAVELREDSKGLTGAFRVSKTSEGDAALELVKDGAVDAFSVGFAPIRDLNRAGIVVRTEVKLLEASLVGFPAYADALIEGVRSAELDTPYLNLARRRLELLRAETGLSR